MNLFAFKCGESRTHKISLIIAVFFLQMLITTTCFAINTICSPPICKVFNVTATDGVVITVNDWGASDPDRPAILFLHGSPNSGLFWLYQFNSLLRLKYRLITMDWRPYGLTDKPEIPESYSQNQAAEDVSSVLEALNVKKVILVGHSAGGVPLESYLNAYNPHHNKVNVKGVVLVDAIVDLNGLQFIPPTSFALTLQAINATTADEFRAANQRFLSLSFYKPIDLGLNNFLLSQQLITPQAPRKALLTSFATPGNYNINLNSVSVKTLIIWGENDEIVTLSGANYLHNNILGSQLVILPKTGHNPMIERPHEFNRLLDKFADLTFKSKDSKPR